MFFIWGSVSLACSLIVFLQHPRSFTSGLSSGMLGLIGGLGIAFLFSLDRSISLFPTLQALVLMATWLMLRSLTPPPEKIVWQTLMALAAVTIAMTLYQILIGPNALGIYDTYGLLPLNPSFNAIWMATLATAFWARVLQRQRDFHSRKCDRSSSVCSQLNLSRHCQSRANPQRPSRPGGGTAGDALHPL